MKRTKGLSMAVTAALLILVSIAIVAALWLYSQRFTQGGDVVQAQANLISNRYVNGKPVHTIDISVQSKTQTRLKLVSITIIGTANDGSSVTGSITSGTGTVGGYSITVSPAVNSNDAYVEPNSMKHFTISMIGGGRNFKPLVDISFQLVLQDDAGNKYTVQTNSLTLG